MSGRHRQRPRRDSAWIGFLTGVLIGTFLFVAPSLLAGGGQQDKKDKKEKTDKKAAQLSKAFQGKLPITELSEDEAILHALNRLGFGARPGEVEEIKRGGLESWVQAQLHPETLGDRDTEARLSAYPTLRLSAANLLNEYPSSDVAAKRLGIT